MGTLATLGILGFGELFVWSVCKAVTKVSAHFFKNPLHYFPVCFPGCSLNRDSFRGQGGNPPAGGSHGGCSCRNLVKAKRPSPAAAGRALGSCPSSGSAGKPRLPRLRAMPKQTVTTRVKSTKLTDQHPWVEILFRLLGAFGSTVLFGIRLVIAEFLFGIMAWVPVKAVGALLAAVPLVYTGRKNLESFISCKNYLEALAELTKLLTISGPFIWFGLRCLDWELGVRAMVAALLSNFSLLVSSVSMSSWLKRCRAFLEKDGRWFTSQKPLPAVRWQSALQQMNAEWAQDIRRKQLHVATNPMLNATIVVLLITNTIFLGFEVDDKRSAAAGGNWFFVMMELSFAAVFIGEFFIRFHHQRWEFFADNWNVFDYTLVLMGFNDSMMTLLTPLAGTQLARAFRVFRGLRVARNVRTVKKLSGLWFIIGGLLETVKTMMLVAAIASILIFALGVALTTVIGSQPFILELWRQASIYMGSVARSMLTILQVATLDGWTQSVARPLWELSPFGFFTLILSVVVQLGQA
eukprot:s4217_g1.t2